MTRQALHSTARLAIAAVIALYLAGAPAYADGTEVTIDNFTFTPPVLTVARGTRVTWTNHDDIPHTVTSSQDPGKMHSPVLDTDEMYILTFDTPGTYGFFCSLHPHMQSQVVVR